VVGDRRLVDAGARIDPNAGLLPVVRQTVEHAEQRVAAASTGKAAVTEEHATTNIDAEARRPGSPTLRRRPTRSVDPG
jgi:hypothetical protein